MHKFPVISTDVTIDKIRLFEFQFYIPAPKCKVIDYEHLNMQKRGLGSNEQNYIKETIILQNAVNDVFKFLY